MARKIKNILLFCLAIFLIAGTSASLPKPILPIGMPDIGFPTDQFGKDFSIHRIRQDRQNLYQGEYRFFFAIVPISADGFEFDHVAAKAFLYDQGNWIELKNISLQNSFDSIDHLHAGFPLITINSSEIPNPAILRIFFITNITDIITYKGDLKMNKKSVDYATIYLQP